MMPVVFTIPGLNYAIPGFGFALMIGFLWAIWWAAHRASKSGGNPDVVLNLGFVSLIGGVVGCRLMYVFHYWDKDFANRGSLIDALWAIVDVSRGGMEYYGGLLTATLLAVIWIVRVEKVSLRWYLDIVAPSVVLGLAVGRVGCLLNGCCYGSTCDGPQAIRFPFGGSASMEQWQARLPDSGLPRELLMIYPPGIVRPLSRESLLATDAQIAAAIQEEKAAREERDAARAAEKSATGEAKRAAERRAAKAIYSYAVAEARFKDIRHNMERYHMTAAEIRAVAAKHMSLPVHPTQIYSTITAGLLALFLSALYWRRTRDGQVIAAMFIIEPITRYTLEIIRADNPIDTVGSFTISQFISLCLVPIGIIILFMLQRMPPRSPRAKIWVPPPDEKQAKLAASA